MFANIIYTALLFTVAPSSTISTTLCVTINHHVPVLSDFGHARRHCHVPALCVQHQAVGKMTIITVRMCCRNGSRSKEIASQVMVANDQT